MKSKQQLELFHNDLLEQARKKDELGRLYNNIYNLKFFTLANQTQEYIKLNPVIHRHLHVYKKEVTVNLRPQILPNDKQLEFRYLGEREQNILDLLVWKWSNCLTYDIGGLPSLMIGFNEIYEKLGYNGKQIKDSLYLLTSYKVDFNSKEYEGVIPNQFLDSVIIKRGRSRKTLVKFSEGLKKYVEENKYIIMNYERLFNLKLKYSKILYKRLCISNYMDYDIKEKQKFTIKEPLFFMLNQYGITYSTKLKKSRILKEVKQSLEEMTENKIIDFYSLTPTEDRRDYTLTMLLNMKFSKSFGINQKMKEFLIKSVPEKRVILDNEKE